MKNPSLYKKNQRGQAIVLIAALMVALIGALGLAIDGGGMFLLYRDVQNATDAAGLSAAYSLCSGGDPAPAVAISAQMNGFVNGVDGASITVQHPPTSLGDPKYWGDSTYVAIEIKAAKPSYFIQVVYDGPLEVTSVTVSQCEPENNNNLPPNAALVTLNPDSCHAAGKEPFKQKGKSAVLIVGDIYINHNNIACDSVDVLNNGATTFFLDGKLCSQSTAARLNIGKTIWNPYDPDGPDNILGTADDKKAEIEANCDDVPQLTGAAAEDPLGIRGNEPACGPNQGDINNYNGGIAPPGTYSNMSVSKHNTVTLGTGIFCVTGDTKIHGTLKNEPDGVMIYIQGDHDWDTNAGAYVKLSAMTSGPYASILIYSEAGPGTGLRFNGQGHKGLTGTVYAPRTECSIQGGDATVIVGQFICYEFNIEGNGEIKIFYQPSAAFRRPPQFGITQ